MDKTVPAGAALLRDFIASKEAPRGYGTVYGDHQAKLPKPLTSSGAQEIGGVVRSGLAGIYDAIHRALAWKA